jgi:polyhydroxybutyrate depolymerase
MIKHVHTPTWSSALAILFILLWAASAPAQNKGKGKARPDGLEEREWTVGKKARTALVHIPPQAQAKPSALVFVFHGHGGTMEDAVKEFAIHKHWPAAIVVYMQGVPTPQGDDPKGELAGWQYFPGEQKDRDVQFFDTVRADLSGKYKVDDERVFAAGFSNGGGFSIALWSARGDKLAATASVCMRVFDGFLQEDSKFKPTSRPFLMVAGEKDPMQTLPKMEASLKKVLKLNQCQDGKDWIQKGCTLYPSKIGAPVLFMRSNSGHEVPHAAQTAIVDFFNEIKPGAGRNKVAGVWQMNQPSVGTATLRITENAGKLEVQEVGNGNARGTKTVYRDGLLVINWEVNEDLRGYWVLHLNEEHTNGKGKTVFTRFKNYQRGELRKLDGQDVRIVEGVTMERIVEK